MIPADPPTPSAPAAPEAREQHPGEGEWRADPLARSLHSRLDQEVRPPAEDFDEERAAELCAALCRGLLGDFSPALLLLSTEERRRVQALVAYTHTLFDFARQSGVEGERLAQINRWEFTLELALSGEKVGQPIFVAMAREQALRPWPEPALAELAACARRRAMHPRPASPREADALAERLARAAATAILGREPAQEIAVLGGALLRLHALQSLGPESGRNRCPIPESELPIDFEAPPAPGQLVAAARRECQRLRPRLLKAPRGLVELTVRYRRAAVFSLLAALKLLVQMEEGETDLLDRPPRLGILSRLGLLARARWVR
jgi:phytoene/squalene synthetase